MSVKRFPLLVQFEFHPASMEAADTAQYLHDILNTDPAVPSLRIPTCFTPDDGSGEPPEPRIAAEADRVLVMLLADDHLAVAAKRPTKNGITWGDYVTILRSLSETSGNRFMPVQLSKNAWPVDTRLMDMNFLPAWESDNLEGQRKTIARRLVHLLIRQFRSHATQEDAPPVTIFLSYAKKDFESEPRVVQKLLAHLTAIQPEKTWFDSGDIATGSQFRNAIEKGVKDTALLAVVTDSYSSRSWCCREVLLAKHYQRPVVIVDAVQEREVRRFPYLGNTPVIRWKENPQDVVDILLREGLRHVYAEESLKQRMREGDVILPVCPELVTVVHRGKDMPILYPDPPLGPEEIAVLKPTGVRVETPLERHARAHNLRNRGLKVAMSISSAEDMGRFGLRRPHLDSIFLDLSRYLLVAGVRLAYGGHLKTDGYTLKLANLLRDPIVEQLRGDPPQHQTVSELVTYLAWPMISTVHDEAQLGPLVEVIHCDRPPDIDESVNPSFVAQPYIEIPSDSALHRLAWSRGLTVMRERQTAEVGARIVVGGKIGRPQDGYLGRMPGVFEEALLSIRTKRPVYLVGAFGGCARLVLDALDGVPRQELTWAYHRDIPHVEALKHLYTQRGLTWDDYETLAAELKECGIPGLKNGLTVEENRELARSRSAERIVELVLHGLQQCYPPVAAGGGK